MTHAPGPLRPVIAGHRSRLAAVALLATAAACGGTPADVELPRRSFRVGGIAAGTEITADSVFFVRFDSLVSDSRCPREHVCVWHGDVALQLSHRLGRGVSRPFLFHVSYAPRDTVIQDHRLTVDSVTPHARFGEVVARHEYRVWMSLRSLR